jgi:hypothetical protein
LNYCEHDDVHQNLLCSLFRRSRSRCPGGSAPPDK